METQPAPGYRPHEDNLALLGQLGASFTTGT
jgi:hypothetical protein